MNNKRPLAVFLWKNYRNVPAFITKLRSIIDNITNNAALFATPDPTIASVTGHVDDLDDAQAKAVSRDKEKVAIRNQKKRVVVQDVYDWLAYVQKLADDAPDEETSIVIIVAAGFSVKVKGVIVKPDLKIENGIASGSVKCSAKGAPRNAYHEWQTSPNGLNWSEPKSSKYRYILLTGFTRLSTLHVRHRLNIKDVPQPWSQPVNIVVL